MRRIRRSTDTAVESEALYFAESRMNAAVSMARPTVSNPIAAAEGKSLGDIERNANFTQQAANHNLGRNVRVLKVLTYLAVLRQKGVQLAGAVECTGNPPQHFSSSKDMTIMGVPAQNFQAAHFLPGVIRIGGKPLWQLVTERSAREQLEDLFAQVEHLPLAFNQADSAAEASKRTDGLRAAFGEACAKLIGWTGAAKLPPGQLNIDLVQAGYEHWQSMAIAAIDLAVTRKSARPGVPPLTGNRFEGFDPALIAARSAPANSEWNRDESLRVLQLYAKDQPLRNWRWVISDCQPRLIEVLASFRA